MLFAGVKNNGIEVKEVCYEHNQNHNHWEWRETKEDKKKLYMDNSAMFLKKINLFRNIQKISIELSTVELSGCQKYRWKWKK